MEITLNEMYVPPSVRRVLLISNCSMNEKAKELTVCFREFGDKLMSALVDEGSEGSIRIEK